MQENYASNVRESFLMSVEEGLIQSFTDDQVARLTDLKPTRLRYWDRTNFFKPSFRYSEPGEPTFHAYSFKDVVCLRTLSILVNRHGIRLAELRKTLAGLLDLDQSRWATETLYVLGPRVYFEHPDDGLVQSAYSDQLALKNIPLKKVVGAVKEAARQMGERSAADIGQIVKIRNVQGSRPVFAGTRITADAVKSFLDDGYDAEAIVREYPALTVADIRAAQRYFKQKAA